MWENNAIHGGYMWVKYMGVKFGIILRFFGSYFCEVFKFLDKSH